MNKILVSLLLLICSVSARSQETIIGMTAGYLYGISTIDLGKKYTNFSNVGLNFGVKLRNNLLFGLEGQFMFGSDYKDKQYLGSMVNKGGFIIGENMSVENPRVEGRGGAIFGEAGYIFALGKENRNSGICTKMGLGYSFYQIFTYVDDNQVTQLSGEYRNGYKRAEGGATIVPFVGYQYYGPKKWFNASIGFQGLLSFTSYNGKWDYGTNTSLEGQSFTNLMIGPKATFTIVFKTFWNTDAGDGYYYD